MQSRRDQVQAYFFVVSRLVSAVVHGKPDSLQAPNKRLSTGTVLGIVVGGLIMAVFGIIGIFVPGGDTSWRTAGAIVMNEDNGATYVYLDGQLRPVLNYSSARLAAGASGTGEVSSVSQASLEGTPVGQPIGIPGAPDSLPAADALDTSPWTVCAPRSEGGQGAPSLAVLLGHREGRKVTDSQGVLVSTPDAKQYLLWQGKRYLVPDQGVREALGYGDTAPAPVTAGWLNPVPQGEDLRVPDTEGAGEPGPRIDGAASVVGQVYEVRNPAIDSDQFYLVRRDGLAPLNRTTAALLLASSATKRAYEGQQVAPVSAGPAAVQGVPVSDGPDLTEGLPPHPPELVAPAEDSVACLRFGPSATGRLDVVAEVLPLADVTSRTVRVPADSAGTTADLVGVPAGGGVLARNLSAPGASPGTTYLVSESGMRYPLASADVAQALGYDVSSAVNVPGELLGLLPAGPVLSGEAALQSRSGAS